MDNNEKINVKFVVTKSNASQVFRQLLKNEITLDEYRKSKITFRTVLESRDIQMAEKRD